ncbi:2885_t:CDS:1, partial [Gigaspora margarita]
WSLIWCRGRNCGTYEVRFYSAVKSMTTSGINITDKAGIERSYKCKIDKLVVDVDFDI